jgi:predicted outer membrane repeat protein
MHFKPARTIARAAAFGGALVLGLGSAQAAMAQPVYRVSCNADALDYALSHVSSGSTLSLADGCNYHLPGGLIDDVVTLTIVGNGATLQGGGPDSDYAILTVMDGSALTLDDVNFSDGSAPKGGAIDSDGNVTINDGTFSHNRGEDGGAIYTGNLLTINGAVFTSNEGIKGGAIDGDSANTTITGAQFGQNKAADGGGAIWVQYVVTVADSSFDGNTAEYGGAIYNHDHLTLTDVTGLAGTGNAFTGNVADLGGAIYNYAGNVGGAIIGDSLIVYNEASDVGGGIYNACNAIFTLSGSTVFGNVTDNIYNEGDCVV